MSRFQIRQLEEQEKQLKSHLIHAEGEQNSMTLRHQEFTLRWEEAWKPWKEVNQRLGEEREMILNRARRILEKKQVEYQARFFLVRIFATPPSESLQEHLNGEERRRLRLILDEMDHALRECENSLRSDTNFMEQLKDYEFRTDIKTHKISSGNPAPLPPENGVGPKVHPEFLELSGFREIREKTARLRRELQTCSEMRQSLQKKHFEEIEQARRCQSDPHASMELAQKLLSQPPAGCEFCQRQASELKPQFLWPHQLGGLPLSENLAWACPTCFSNKEDRTLFEFSREMRLDFIDLLRRLEDSGKTI